MADGTVSNLKAEDVYAELVASANTFYPGTFIDDIDVGGMTKEQAVEAVNNSLKDAKPVEVEYKLKLDGQVYPLDFSDAKFTYNTQEVVDEAFAQHRALEETAAPVASGVSSMQFTGKDLIFLVPCLIFLLLATIGALELCRTIWSYQEGTFDLGGPLLEAIAKMVKLMCRALRSRPFPPRSRQEDHSREQSRARGGDGLPSRRGRGDLLGHGLARRRGLHPAALL